MKALYLIVKEIGHRKINFFLSVFGALAAVTLFVFFVTASEGSRQEAARITRNIGMNLHILPKETDMAHFWITGFSDQTMPEEYVHKMASHTGLDYAHLLPLLKKRIQWRGQEVILVGVLPEVSPVGKKKPSMSYEVSLGEVFVGFELARRYQIEAGQGVDILGTDLKVSRCLPEVGSEADLSLFAHLHDVQAMVGLEGRINEIQAINCVCFDRDEPLQALREQLAVALPEAKVVRMKKIAEAREKVRFMVEQYLGVIIPATLIVCGVWIGLLATINVRERRHEIGILRALGYGSGMIGKLFLGKALLVGLVAAGAGFGIGTWLALTVGPGMFQIMGKNMVPIYHLLIWAILLAPLFSMISAFVPTMMAITQDPAVTLAEE